jgi:hypothetical protein
LPPDREQHRWSIHFFEDNTLASFECRSAHASDDRKSFSIDKIRNSGFL